MFINAVRRSPTSKRVAGLVRRAGGVRTGAMSGCNAPICRRQSGPRSHHRSVLKRGAGWHAVVLLCLFASLSCNGIIWKRERRAKADLGVKVLADQLSKSAAVRDTIGAIAYFDGMRPLRVRGYGLVVGLGRNGSRDCPRDVRERLVQAMYREQHVTAGVVGVTHTTPEQLIDSRDTAVVVVQGQIPPAVVAGTRFDAAVTALPGTQTKSLRGGRLYSTDLEVVHTSSSGTTSSGRREARAGGPVFLNPFSGEDSATKSNPLQGIVIGGGQTLSDRPVRLVLTQASYAMSRRISDRINAYFPGAHRVADALSPSFVQLRIPPELAGDEGHFLALVRVLFLSRNPAFADTRARELAEELLHPDAPHAQIALALEGLGRPALPILGELYSNSKDYVSFHSSVAGLRLGDHLACDALARHAGRATSPYRFQAIRALGEAPGIGAAAQALRSLLNDVDPRVAIAAYEALMPRGDVAIESTLIGGDGFWLDRVARSGARFIYVSRGGERRIALFGEGMGCDPPLFYRAPDGSFTMTAEVGDETLTLIRQAVATGSVSPPIPAALKLPELLALLGSDAGVDGQGRVVGLGLGYGAIVRSINRLCLDGAIEAKFILEQPNAAELFGPPRPAGRPEAE